MILTSLRQWLNNKFRRGPSSGPGPKWSRFGVRRRAPIKRPRSAALVLENLEDRAVPAVLEVVPGGARLDGTHFASFQDAYNHVRAGDTIQIDHGATLSSSGGIVTIAKQITVRGEAGYAPTPVTSDVEVLSGTSGVVFDHLNFSSPNGLELDAGSRQTTVKNSVLDMIVEDKGLGKGNSGNLIEDNTITGFARLNGDGTIQTADQIIRNHFTVNGNLYMINNNGALVRGNTFDSHLDGQSLDFQVAAIEIHNSTNVQIVDNKIHVSSTNSAATGPHGIYIYQDPGLSGPLRTSVTIAGNTIDTSGKRIGLAIDNKGGQSNELAVKVEGNDFRNNAVGISLWGNLISAGTIDLGGGALGSMGQNDFRGFTAATAAQGRFAIALHMTNAQAVVAAQHNLWSESNLGAVIKDGTDNVAHAEATIYDPDILPDFQKGTGHIDLGLPVWSPGGSGGAPGGQPNWGPGSQSRLLVDIDPWVLRLGSEVYVKLHTPDPAPDLALDRASPWLVSAQQTKEVSSVVLQESGVSALSRHNAFLGSLSQETAGARASFLNLSRNFSLGR
jgi:hypothetical protein